MSKKCWKLSVFILGCSLVLYADLYANNGIKSGISLSIVFAFFMLVLAVFIANFFRKKFRISQSEVAKRDEKILHFFDSLNEPSLLVNDDEDFSLIAANKAFQKEFSYADFPNRSISLIDIFGKDSKILKENIKEKSENECFNIFLGKSGRTYSVKKFQLDSESIAISFYDSTESTAFKKLMADSLISNRAVLQRVQDCLFYFDSDLRIVWANASSQEVFGLEFSDMQFRQCNEVICKSSGICKECPIKKAQVLKKFAFSNSIKTNTDHVFSIAASPQIDENGDYELILVSVIDITELQNREQKQRQVQKMEVMGSLAGGVAHDFNNILQAILGYAELMAPEISENSEDLSLLEGIVEAGLRGQSLVKQMMFFSRRETFKPQRIEVNKQVTQIVGMIKRIIGETYKINFKPYQDEIYFVVDPSQFDQILTNLCVNARDAMKKNKSGSIEISVIRGDLSRHGAVQKSEKGKYVVIEVADHGEGIPPEIQKKIFTPFFTTKKSGEGTGMGLASVHGIVKRHKGKINVESKVGQGSTFRVFLPVSGEITPVYELVGTDKKIYQNKFPGKTAILAEDEEMVRELSKRMLKKLGFNVIAVSDGQEALEAFESNPDNVDLLVFDVVMPELNGRDAFEKICEIRKGVPIVFCTGYSRKELPDDFLDRTDSEILKKPFSISDLGECIARHLDEQNALKALSFLCLLPGF